MQDEDTTPETIQSDETDETPEKAPQLLQIELRVLGALMEKQLTTPDAYPLTLNSLLSACNQKSSREPVTSYHQGEVARALQELQDKNFVRKEPGSRSDKYEQRFINHLGLGKKQQALLCVLMLRGPQSLSELNTRTQRMCEFADMEELELSIERLCERAIPYVVRLDRQSGQRGERFEHLFSGTPLNSAKTTPERTSDAATVETASPAQSGLSDSTNVQSVDSSQAETIQLLEMEITSLNEKVNALNSETALMRQQIDTLLEMNGIKNQP